jgi:hypothetical protein
MNRNVPVEDRCPAGPRGARPGRRLTYMHRRQQVSAWATRAMFQECVSYFEGEYVFIWGKSVLCCELRKRWVLTRSAQSVHNACTRATMLTSAMMNLNDKSSSNVRARAQERRQCAKVQEAWNDVYLGDTCGFAQGRAPDPFERKRR